MTLKKAYIQPVMISVPPIGVMGPNNDVSQLWSGKKEMENDNP